MPDDAAAMADDTSRGGCVHAAELLDPLHQKEQQDQADNEVHCCKAFTTDWARTEPLRLLT